MNGGVATHPVLLPPLFLAAAALALLLYWLLSGLRLPAARQGAGHRTWLWPVQARLQWELTRSGLHWEAQSLLQSMLLCAAAGAAMAWPLRNTAVMLVLALAGGALPYQAVRAAARRREGAVTRAAAPTLLLLSRLAQVRHHPYLAIADSLPLIPAPLQAEFRQAVAECAAGSDLPQSLRELAGRCCENFYLHQLAELVAVNIRFGGDLSEGLQRLVDRLRTLEELRAEEAAELFGYRWLTRILLVAGLAPIPYWAITGSSSFEIFRTQPLAQASLIWALLSGLLVVSLPYWMAIED